MALASSLRWHRAQGGVTQQPALHRGQTPGEDTRTGSRDPELQAGSPLAQLVLSSLHNVPGPVQVLHWAPVGQGVEGWTSKQKNSSAGEMHENGRKQHRFGCC